MRFKKKYCVFKKGYLPGWTEEVFVVARVMSGVVPTSKIDERDGTPLTKTLYGEDLQKVTVEDTGCFAWRKS